MDREFFWALLQVAIFLPLVLAGAYLVARYITAWRFCWPRSGSYLEVAERVMLSPRAGLYVVRLGDKYCLFALSESGLSLLRELPDYWAASRGGEPGLRRPRPWPFCGAGREERRGGDGTGAP
ncbi:MAG: flagellar biosynthetic protein FliO [Moorellales bacterium]